MSALKNRKNSILFVFFPIILLIIFAFVNFSTSKNDVSQLMSDSNSFLPQLTEVDLLQIDNTLKTDSLYVYSSEFYQTDTERQLVLINKNPSKREFLNHIKVHVYPENPSQYKNLSNYKPEGYLDYTAKTKPVMANYNLDNYSVKKINLPYINIKKVYVYQPGIYKHTFENPYDKIAVTNLNRIKLDKENLYLPILQVALSENDIQFLPYLDEKLDKTMPLVDFVKTKMLQ